MQNLKFLKNYYKGYVLAHIRKPQELVEKPYKDIGILNPAIGTANLGDQIINESIQEVLRSIYPEALFTDFPTQLHTSFDGMKLMSEKDLLFVAGTNLLSSNLETIFQWKIHNGHKKFLRNKVVLFGCGWWQYQEEVNSYSEKIYNAILNRDLVLHSVRDQYTLEKLKNIGVTNVVNTSCPTLWSLNPAKCKLIPKNKSENVVTTLTFYHKNPSDDLEMLKILSKHYKTVYLWIQGLNDVYYYNKLKMDLNDNIVLLSPNLESFDKILERGNIDYIGTRLHAGVRALQKNIRTLILAVDNRALEIGKDVNLNVIRRENVNKIEEFISSEYLTDITLPSENIKKWKESIINSF